MEKDLSELNLLSIFYFAMAGLTALTGSIPIVHVLLGLKMVSDPSFLGGGGPPPPFNPGWLFVGEDQWFDWIGKQPDAAEGVTSFLEKRSPVWKMAKSAKWPVLPR